MACIAVLLKPQTGIILVQDVYRSIGPNNDPLCGVTYYLKSDWRKKHPHLVTKTVCAVVGRSMWRNQPRTELSGIGHHHFRGMKEGKRPW